MTKENWIRVIAEAARSVRFMQEYRVGINGSWAKAMFSDWQSGKARYPVPKRNVNWSTVNIRNEEGKWQPIVVGHDGFFGILWEDFTEEVLPEAKILLEAYLGWNSSTDEADEETWPRVQQAAQAFFDRLMRDD